MRISSIITLVIAVVMGLTAVFLMNGQGPSVPQVPMIDVVSSKTDIPRGTILNAVMLETRKVTKDAVGEGALTEIAKADDRMLLEGMSKGEILYDKQLAPKGQRGLATQIKDGMRAFTIETPRDSTSVSGLIVPGNRVDVILNLTSPMTEEMIQMTGGGTTLTLLQNIEVLAVDNRFDNSTAQAGPGNSLSSTAKSVDYKAVTLLVTPEEASMLTLGQGRGTLHLSLRNPNDNRMTETPPTLLRDIQANHTILSRLNVVDSAPSEKTKEIDVESKKGDETETKEPAEPPKRRLKRIRMLKGQIEQTVIHQSAP